MPKMQGKNNKTKKILFNYKIKYQLFKIKLFKLLIECK